MFHVDQSGVYRAAAFERFTWLDHGFGSRRSPHWLEGRPVATLLQIHSATIHRVDGLSGCLGQGDALIGDTPGLLMAVRTADCLPIILAAPTARAAGIIHCGWRGAVQNIAARTVERMCKDFNCTTQDLHAAIGPGIGACCFEVGADVAAQFQPHFPELELGRGKTTINLAEAARRQLTAVGIPAAQISCGAPCTACSPGDFHSWRRDRTREGRMLSAVGIREREAR